jgi:hypothetical protein
LEESKIREEALEKARARAALKKIEVPELTEEQLAEVSLTVVQVVTTLSLRTGQSPGQEPTFPFELRQG